MLNISKKARRVCVLLFFCLLLPIAAQDAAKNTAQQITNESLLPIGAAAAGTVAVKQSSASSIWILIKVVFVLALVCAGVYGVVYLMKKSTGTKAGNDPYLKNVASLYFSPNKSIQVISFGEHAYLVGITDQAINLIAEVKDRELVDAMNLQSDKKNPVPTGSFQSVIANFIPGFGKKDAASGSFDKTAGDPMQTETGDAPLSGVSLLRAQRERLQRSGRAGEDVSRGSTDGSINGGAE